MGKPIIALIDRLMEKVEIQPNGCWWFTACLNPQGYGIISSGATGKALLAHKVSYEHFHGPVPDGLDLDHTCHDPTTCSGGITCLHRRCCNPDHVEPVTRIVNASPSRGHSGISIRKLAAVQKAKTHCPQGHEYTPENTYRVTTTNGGIGRMCLTCKRFHTSQHNAKVSFELRARKILKRIAAQPPLPFANTGRSGFGS